MGCGAVSRIGVFILLAVQFAARVSAQPMHSALVDLQEGERLARIHCVSCHAFPEPDAVDVATWRDQILPRMKWRLGFTTPDLDRSPNVRLLREHQRIPLSPVISEEQWLNLIEFYLQRAPTMPLPQEARVPIDLGLPGFQAVVPPHRRADPAITAIKVLPGGGALLADAVTEEVQLLDSGGHLQSTLRIGNSISALRISDGLVVAAGLGSFEPSDEAKGAVYLLRILSGRVSLAGRPLTSLLRTTDALREDLNEDGSPDFALSIFGNNLGRFSWFRASSSNSYTEEVLFTLPGAVRAEWVDVNSDGRKDLAALVAQETEALLVFLNCGSGEFTQQVVFQRPPFWGHSYFETADFNGDRKPDFLVANGDNGEFASPPKRVHGIRVYLSQPDGAWHENYFFPMNGVYKASAHDFDQDGDLDIAAISYFPDYQKSPRESFVLLQNQGGLTFKAYTFAECALGRWICMDVGDFDGDGAEDIVLGSCIKGPTPVPAKLMEAWKTVKLPVIVLRNSRGNPPPRALQ